MPKSSSKPRLKSYDGRLIFDHLPKTGGTAVNSWLKTQLGTACVSRPVIGFHRPLIYGYGGEFSIISGHIKFKHGEGLDPRYQYVTCLREPVDRSLSWLYFVLNKNKKPNALVGVKKFLQDDGWQTHPTTNHIRNQVTRHFASIDNSKDSLSPSNLVTKAFNTLKKYDVVGVFEDMPGFLKEFSELVRVEPPGSIERKNETRNRPSIDEADDSLKNRIEEINKLDLKLYEKVTAWKSQTYTLGINNNGTPKVNKWHVFNLKKSRNRVRKSSFKITDVALSDGKFINFGDDVCFRINVLVKKIIKNLHISLTIYDNYRNIAAEIDNNKISKKISIRNHGEYCITCLLKADLPIGKYNSSIIISESTNDKLQVLARDEQFLRFEVLNRDGMQSTLNTHFDIDVFPL